MSTFKQINEENIILHTDSYKLTHWLQLMEDTEFMYDYMESRGGTYPSTVFMGLQYIRMRYLSRRITMVDIDEAEAFTNVHIGKNLFNRKGWEYIVNKHDGKLPLHIKAVPEGTLVPVRNVLMTIEHTDPECKWLVSYFETMLMQVWGCITVATNSYYCKKLLRESAQRTGCDESYLAFGLHDFGYRGTPTKESAAMLGLGHLASFMGSDNIPAIVMANNYYKWDLEQGLPAYSVVASEHAVATPFGREREKDYVMNMLTKFPSGTISVVGDSYDIYKFATMISTDPEIKENILQRDGRFVLRPDSGDPVEVVTKILDILWANIGGTYTPKHFKLLNTKIRVLQGDGIDYNMISHVLQAMENNKYASENIIFGSGGGLLQKFDRDTQKFAIKCSYAVIGGKEVNVQKDPITSSGKKSKQGKLKLHHNGRGQFCTISSAEETPEMFNSYIDSLETVFLNGENTKEYSLSEIRERLNNQA